ncbi:hypothetical protein [Methylomonas sp. AM2-LC]|uniref:hypothetical protein n=1 Tax=Methylomonas sp. AM2-LC TaxID=3153301 RepID=UPI0032679B76
MNISIIQRLIQLLADAFFALSVKSGPMEIEKLAILIHQAMDHNRRIYHTSAHIFELCEGMQARQVLAALFHDIVYQQLDCSFPWLAQNIVDNIGKIENNTLQLNASPAKEWDIKLCMAVFGYQPAASISLNHGANEFLSAIFAARQLQKLLSAQDLLAITACIEATIPFRGTDADGLSYPLQLAERVQTAASLLDIHLDDVQLSTLVTEAITLANRDVANFAHPDPSHFLATTWQLLEEANIVLSKPKSYTIQAYRNSLLGMERFLTTLNPALVFHSYQNTPNPEQLLAMQQAAQHNIQFANLYLGVKITGIAVIEALALLTGGDCAIAEFLGDPFAKRNQQTHACQFIPHIAVCQPVDEALLQVLDSGRSQPCDYDLNESPFSAYLCRILGQTQVMALSQHARQFFIGTLDSQAFLNLLPQQVIHTIASACANVMLSRAPALLALTTDFTQ